MLNHSKPAFRDTDLSKVRAGRCSAADNRPVRSQRTFFRLALYVASVAALCSLPARAQWPNGYGYSGVITVSHLQVPNTDQTNFPVLVAGTYSDLATVSNSGKVTNANGYDIIFTSDPNGLNKLNFERDSYSPSGKVVFWVQLPNLSHTNDTVFYVFYGNASVTTDPSTPTATWDHTFLGVWHLNGDPSGPAPQELDSTANANHLTAVGPWASSNLAAGFIGNGIFSTSTNDGFTSSSPSLTPTTSMTASAWINTTIGSGIPAIMAQYQFLDSSAGYYFIVNGNIGHPRYKISAGNNGGTDQTTFDAQAGTITDGNWHYVAASYNSGANPIVYVDGSPVPAPPTNGSTSPFVGSLYNTTSFLLIPYNGSTEPFHFQGTVDEPRVAGVARSGDWIATEYNNQSNPAGFYTATWGLTTPSAPGLSVSQLNLNFSAITGAANPQAQQISLSSVNVLPLGSWTATTSCPWITLASTANGTGSSSISNSGAGSFYVQVAPNGLPYGTTQSTIQITSAGATGSPQTVNVALNLSPMPWPNGYTYSGTFTVPHAQIPNTDQVNFPVLVSGTFPPLASTTNGGFVTSQQGYDIIFTADEAGKTILPFQRESYSPTTGQAIFWVQLPLLSHTVDTVFYVFYGNSAITTDLSTNTGVWDSNYAAVWHLDDNAATTAVADSTSHAATGTAAANTSTKSVAGIIGNALSFNGTTDQVATALVSGKTFTWEGWVNSSIISTLPYQSLITIPGSSYMLMDVQAAAYSLWSPDSLGGNSLGVTGLANSTWYHLAFVRSGDNSATGYTAYVNGVQKGQAASGVWSSTGTIALGARIGTSGQNLNGALDEVRISNSARSADWIATEYLNQSNPSAFYTASLGLTYTGTTSSPALSVTSQNLQFTGTTTVPPAAQSLGISSSNGTALAGWTATVSSSYPWITLATSQNGTYSSSVSGSGASTIYVQVATASLPAGGATTNGSFVVSSSSASPASVNVSVAATVNSPAGGTWPNGYTYAGTVTVSHLQVPNTDQTNFPVLFSGTYAALATVANGGQVTNANGYDIIFTSDPNGLSLLNFERQSYSPATGKVAFWVQVPTLSHTTDTVFYLFYGNSSVTTDPSNRTGTWDSNYLGVWHLENSLVGNTLPETDSTTNGNNLGSTGSWVSSNVVPGEIGNAVYSNYNFGFSGASQPISTSLTLSSWINTAQSGVPIIMSQLSSSGATAGYSFLVDGTSNRLRLTLSASNNGGSAMTTFEPSSGSVDDGKWHYVVATYSSGAGVTFYLDGASLGTQGNSFGGSLSNAAAFTLVPEQAYYFLGTVDEARVSNTVRSADWVATEYKNQSSPATFYSAVLGLTNSGASAPPALSATSALSFMATSGSGNPAPQPVSIGSSNSTALASWTATVSPSYPWITLSTSVNGTYSNSVSGSGATTIYVQVATGSLSAGGTTTNGSIGISAPGAIPSTATVNVGVTVNSAAPPIAWPNGYGYAGTITVSHLQVSNTDQMNFPVLVAGTYPALANTSSGGQVTSTSGYDIIFTSDANGLNKLPFERETYSPSTGQVAFWVQLPDVSHTTDTVFYVFYGNAAVTTDQSNKAGTWDSNFSGVWHMNDNASSTVVSDSTGKNNGTSAANTSSKSTAGVVTGALSFNGSTDQVTTNLVTGKTFTWEAWVNSPAMTSGTYQSVLTVPGASYMLMDVEAGADSLWSADGLAGATLSAAGLANSNWYHLVLVRSGDSAANGYTAYVNGVAKGQAASGVWSTTAALAMGARIGTSGQNLTGALAEVRVSNSVRSADWIAAEYRNISAPASFYTAVLGLTNSSGVTLPALSTSTEMLNYTGTVGSPNPAPQPVSISSSNSSPLTSWTATVNSSYPWITLATSATGTYSNTVSGTGAATIYVQVAIGSLAAGGATTNGSFTVTASGANPSTATVNVSVTVNNAAPPSPWPNGYSYSATITISHLRVPNTDQTNFPVLVSGTYPTLATTANGGQVANANGYDIMFTSDPYGLQPLPFERESYSPTTGQVTFWVGLPLVSHTTDTVFYMFYGNSSISTDQSDKSDVWDTNFLGVWHLADNAANTTVADSTGLGNNGTAAANTSTKTATGVFGPALSFNGTTDQVSTAVVSGKTFTWEAWVNSPAITTGNYQSVLAIPGSAYMLMDVEASADSLWSPDGLAGTGLGVGPLSNNNWYHLVFVRSGDSSATGYTAYLNGVAKGQAASMVWSSTSKLAIGARIGTAGQNFNGALEEVRVSSIVRSPDWIATEYNNERNPSGFYSIALGQVELAPPTLSLSTNSLSYTGVTGASNPGAQSITITNLGGGTLNWTATSNQAWTTLATTATGTGAASLTGTGPATIWVQMASSSLSANQYSGSITISATGSPQSPQQVTISLNQLAMPLASLSAAPTNFLFTGVTGSGNPTQQSVSVGSGGGGTLGSWTAVPSAPWITLSTAGGTGAQEVFVGANISGLNVGTYTGTVTISAPGAAPSTQVINVSLAVIAQPGPPAGGGQTLYNGIVLPQQWPPAAGPTQAYEVPSYITNPPSVIPIDVGRQLFVDDFLISSTTMARTQHQPTMYAGNPILGPGNSLFADTKNLVMPYSDGVWYDPADSTYKMWFFCGYGNQVCYATSPDGINWTRANLPGAPPNQTDQVLVIGGGRDSDIIWMDLQDHNSQQKYKAFAYYPTGPGEMLVWFSPDGINWTPQSQFVIDSLQDRTTLFWNPFRSVWVDSMRQQLTVPGLGNNPSYPAARVRYYAESPNLSTWTPADFTDTYWTGLDVMDQPYVPGGALPQLYNLDAVAYESVMVGLFSWFNPGPASGGDDPNGALGPDLVEIGVGFSRDGFNWVRPNRGGGPNNAFIPASNTPGTWNVGNTQSAGGGFLVVGDQLYFYFSGRNGTHCCATAGSTGLATLRRDGFYSMDAGATQATLTTRPVKFSGQYMFVNVKDPQGSLQIQALVNGQVVATSATITADSTLQQVTWNGLADLSQYSGQNVQFRFTMTNGQLYSFWVTADPNGASNGYVAAGGPGFTTNMDIPKMP